MDYYINLYNEYYIATEGFKETKNAVIRTLQNLITRLLGFLKRLLYNLYRIKKVSLPKVIYQYICDVDKMLNMIITDGIDKGTCDPDSAATLLDRVKTNSKFTQIMYSTKDAYENSETVNVQTGQFVREMKEVNRQLTTKQVELNNLNYRFDNDPNADGALEEQLALTDIYVKILQTRLNVVSKIFTYNKNKSDVTPLNNATISDDYSI